MTDHPDNNHWIKASASSDAGECVEMRRAGRAVQIRDSKLGSMSPVHNLSQHDFRAWLEGAKTGEFDGLSG
ncbi:hypothetical protein GCM10022223_43490 [Kineosporia mesophila]|uniref:DUF397 domain-containing protein n=1 Tax=Kineosporia mesophila TaxID=566012 RepID=A0ABP7A0I8_9ACTN|nr:DUF397 domain-containing protein [Kineosporia mesophila]